MRKLILVRHGKSSWDYEVGDKDRPLKERGIKDAYLVAKTYVLHHTNDCKMISSPANRALHTAIIFGQVLDYPVESLRILSSCYDFSGEQVLETIRAQVAEVHSLFVFGHNYALTSLANALGDQYIENVPTAGLVEIQFEAADWKSIGRGKTVHQLFPKYLKQS